MSRPKDSLFKRVATSLSQWYKRAQLPIHGGLKLEEVVGTFIKNAKRDSIPLRGSSIAFNLFLALFPALIFMFTLLPHIPVPMLRTQTLNLLQNFMPNAAFKEVNANLNDIFNKPRNGLLSFGLLASLWFTSTGVFTLMQSFNKNDRRSFFKRRFIAILLTLSLGSMLVVGVILIVFGESIIKLLLLHFFSAAKTAAFSMQIIRWAITLLLLFTSFSVLFRFGDTRIKRWKYLFPGAALTCILILITSWGYTFYVNHWSSYNKLYGGLGALIVTMIWLYLNSMAVIVGHEFNNSLYYTLLAKLKTEKQVEKPVTNSLIN